MLKYTTRLHISAVGLSVSCCLRAETFSCATFADHTAKGALFHTMYMKTCLHGYHFCLKRKSLICQDVLKRRQSRHKIVHTTWHAKLLSDIFISYMLPAWDIFWNDNNAKNDLIINIPLVGREYWDCFISTKLWHNSAFAQRRQTRETSCSSIEIPSLNSVNLFFSSSWRNNP